MQAAHGAEVWGEGREDGHTRGADWLSVLQGPQPSLGPSFHLTHTTRQAEMRRKEPPVASCWNGRQRGPLCLLMGSLMGSLIHSLLPSPSAKCTVGQTLC